MRPAPPATPPTRERTAEQGNAGRPGLSGHGTEQHAQPGVDWTPSEAQAGGREGVTSGLFCQSTLIPHSVWHSLRSGSSPTRPSFLQDRREATHYRTESRHQSSDFSGFELPMRTFWCTLTLLTHKESPPFQAPGALTPSAFYAWSVHPLISPGRCALLTITRHRGQDTPMPLHLQQCTLSSSRFARVSPQAQPKGESCTPSLVGQPESIAIESECTF